MLHRKVPTTIVTPAPEITVQRVVVFLHGYASNYRNLARLAPLQDLSDRFGILWVCPDGDNDSWWVDSPIPSGRLYGSFVQKELPLWIKDHLDTGNSPQWTIAGMSMGGYGALKALQAKESPYGSALVFAPVAEPEKYRDKFGLRKVFGPPGPAWEGTALQASQFPAGRPVTIVVGNQDWTLMESRKLAEEITKGNPRTQLLVKEGGHDGAFISRWMEFGLNALTEVTLIRK